MPPLRGRAARIRTMGKSMPKMRRPDTGWHFELIHPRLVTTHPSQAWSRPLRFSCTLDCHENLVRGAAAQFNCNALVQGIFRCSVKTSRSLTDLFPRNPKLAGLPRGKPCEIFLSCPAVKLSGPQADHYSSGGNLYWFP